MARRVLGFAVLLGTLCGTGLQAHHSFGAEYDVSKPFTQNGVVTKVEWTNPHSHIYVDVKDASGKVVNWQYEGYNPAVLLRVGWKPNTMLKAGDVITVFGWRARDGGNWAHAREITIASGQKLFFGPPAGTGDGGNTPAVEVR
jgi:hypothetical protein